MTVLTKPFSGVQVKENTKKPEVEAQCEDLKKNLVEVGMVEPASEDPSRDETEIFLYRATRIGRMTNFCLVLSLLSLLLLGIGAGVHSYRVFVLRNSYAGVCQLPLRDLFSENTIIGASIKEREMNQEAYMNLMTESDRQQNSEIQLVPEFKNLFEFDFDVDVEEENYEMIELPEIFFGRYMHDFKENLTVIIDSLRNHCYVFNLDRTLIPPPRNMFDMIQKMRHGVYDVDFQEIRKNYRVMGDELDSLTGLGHLVPRACFNKQTYRLEELVGDIIVKRSAPAMEKFGEFTGSAIIQYHIDGLN